MPVRGVGLGAQDEQVSGAQDKLVRRDGLHIVVGVRLAEMELAGFPEAQRNDGRVGCNVACLVCMEANVVVSASVARENGMIQLDALMVKKKLLTERFNYVVEFRDGADVAVRPHAAILKARIAVARHGRWLFVDQRLRIGCRNHEKRFFSGKFVSTVLEVGVRRIGPGCTVVQSVVEHRWVESELCFDEIGNNVAVQQSMLNVGKDDTFEGDGDCCALLLHFSLCGI